MTHRDALRRAAEAYLAARPGPPTWADAEALACAQGCHVATAWRHLRAADASAPLPTWGKRADPIAARQHQILITSDVLAALPWLEQARAQLSHKILWLSDAAAQKGLDRIIAALWVAGGDGKLG